MLLGPIFILLCFAVIKGLANAVPKSKPKLKDCSVCLESLSKTEFGVVKALPCGDCFHSNCIDAWLETKSECPICRKAVLPNELEPNPHIPNNVKEPVRHQNTGGTTTGGSRPPNGGGTTTGGSRPLNGGGTTTGGSRLPNGGGTTTGGNRPPNAGGTTTGGSRLPNGGGTTTGGNRPPNAGGTTTGGSRPSNAAPRGNEAWERHEHLFEWEPHGNLLINAAPRENEVWQRHDHLFEWEAHNDLLINDQHGRRRS